MYLSENIEINAQAKGGCKVDIEQGLAPRGQVNIMLGQFHGCILSDEPDQEVS